MYVFYGRLIYFRAICYILWPFGNLVAVWYLFTRFGNLCRAKKSGSLGSFHFQASKEIDPDSEKVFCFTLTNSYSSFCRFPSRRCFTYTHTYVHVLHNAEFKTMTSLNNLPIISKPTYILNLLDITWNLQWTPNPCGGWDGVCSDICIHLNNFVPAVWNSTFWRLANFKFTFQWLQFGSWAFEVRQFIPTSTFWGSAIWKSTFWGSTSLRVEVLTHIRLSTGSSAGHHKTVSGISHQEEVCSISH
jgi:hypothetical protein